MVSVFRSIRKQAARLAAFVALVWVAACEPVAMTGPGIDTSRAIPVALLVPSGSGQSGDDVLARSLENAARLAISDLQGVTVDLRVYSTGGSSAQAAAVATQAVNDGARIILGPVFADAANAAGVAVRPSGVNVLSFSNNTDIAGGNVFVLGNTFQNAASRLVGHAAQQGRNRIYIVHEQTPAGEIGRRAIDTAIARSAAQHAGTMGYAFSQEGVVAAIPSIVSGVRNSGANAVFLTADTAGALPLLAQLLPEAGLSAATTQYIGLTRWDIPPATLSLPGVQGGWFTLPDPGPSGLFQSRYQAAFGSPPHPIAGLAYDGIAAIGALARSGRSDALSASALTQASGFVGVGGIFRFRSDGTNERGLAVAEIRNSQVVVIDPAPRSFGGAGF